MAHSRLCLSMHSCPPALLPQSCSNFAPLLHTDHRVHMDKVSGWVFVGIMRASSDLGADPSDTTRKVRPAPAHLLHSILGCL